MTGILALNQGSLTMHTDKLQQIKLDNMAIISVLASHIKVLHKPDDEIKALLSTPLPV